MSVNVRDKRWIFEFLPEGAQKQAQLERALREKGAVEKELEKMYQEGPSEIARNGLTFEQLQKRISFAEKSKEEALLARESLTSLLHRMEKKHEQQKTQLLLENEEQKKRIKQLIVESEEIAGNRLRLIDEIDNLKRELLLAQKAQDQSRHKCVTEIASLEQKHKLKERQFEEKLRNVEEMNNQSVNELREMLSAQQRMGFKWKDESQALSKKFEETVSSLRNEISKQSKRNDIVNRELVEAKQKHKQVDEDLLSTKAHLEKAQSIAADSESRAEAASKQARHCLRAGHAHGSTQPRQWCNDAPFMSGQHLPDCPNLSNQTTYLSNQTTNFSNQTTNLPNQTTNQRLNKNIELESQSSPAETHII